MLGINRFQKQININRLKQRLDNAMILYKSVNKVLSSQKCEHSYETIFRLFIIKKALSKARKQMMRNIR